MSASSTTHHGLRRWGGVVATRVPALVDAYRFVRNPSWSHAIARDLRRTRSESRFLADLPAPGPRAPVAVVALYRDNIFETKLALVLASALRSRGVRPVVVMPSARTARIRRYAEAFGINDVRDRDRYRLTAQEADEVRRAAATMLSGPIDLDVMRAWTFEGYQIGYHVVSTLIRRTFDGSPDLRIAANGDLLSEIVHEVLGGYVTCGRLLDEIGPALVLVEEANYAHNGPLVDVAVARGIDVIQTIATWRDDALMSKRLTAANRRVDAKSVAPETLDHVATRDGLGPDRALDAELDHDFECRYGGRWVLGTQSQPDTRDFDDDEIVAEIGLDPRKPTAFVFAHVLWDATLFFGVDLFDSYADWLRETVIAAAANPDVNWVVKTHPSNVFRTAHGDVAAGASSEAEIVTDALSDLPANMYVLAPDTPISTRSLYRFGSFGLTVRGTAGLEMACFGKPVLTAGTGFYSGLGFTRDSETREEYLERIATIQSLGPLPPGETALARRVAHTLFVRRPWITESFRLVFDFPERGWNPLDRNVEWSITSSRQIAESDDLRPWADWALTARSHDYLAPRHAAPAPALGAGNGRDA